MSTKMQQSFNRTRVAVAIGAALYVMAGAGMATYETRTPVSGTDDSASYDGSTPSVSISVLANDGDVNASTLAIASQPSSGTVEIVGSAIVYTPNANFSGSDTFTYSVTENDWRTTEGSASFSLTGIDAVAPIAASYIPLGGGNPVTIYNGGSPQINSVDLTAAATGAWNDTGRGSRRCCRSQLGYKPICHPGVGL